MVLALVSLSGCADFMEGYNDAKLHAGEPGYSFPERLARVGDSAVRSAGDFATGYAQGSQSYRPPAYQPIPVHVPQTATVLVPGEGPIFINY